MRKLSILLILIAFIPFASCKKAEKIETQLIYGIENEITTLDPIKTRHIYDLQVIAQIYDGLVKLNENNQITPSLAQSWTTTDFKTWKFKIRNDVYFHDNTPLKPSDVLYSFKRILSPESNSAWILSDIVKDFKIIPPDTFVIELNKPEPFFIHRITSPLFSIVPENSKNIPNFGSEIAIGTGPFKLLKKTETEITLTKNEKYWKKTNGNLSIVKFITIKNDQIRLSELKGGKISLMTVPLTLAPVITKSPELQEKFQISSFPTFNIHFIGFNTSKLDQHLRKAINLAINRTEISKIATFNLAIPNSTPLPAQIWNIKENDIFNPNEAIKELKLSKSTPKLELLIHDKYNSQAIGELIQNQLKKINLNITLKQTDFNTAIDYILKDKADLYLMFFEFVFSSPEPILFNLFHSSKIPVPNFWKLKDKQIDKLLEDLNKPNPENLIPKIIDKINSNPPLVTLFTLKSSIIHPKNIKNIYINAHNIPLLEEVKIQ
jgi:ABC-type transport system substrate-binding protein